MNLAVVCGSVVATIKDPGFQAQSLRLVRKVGPDGIASGDPYIVLDRLGAADGQHVLIETAMEATLGMGIQCAADAAIIAIVDKF